MVIFFLVLWIQLLLPYVSHAEEPVVLSEPPPEASTQTQASSSLATPAPMPALLEATSSLRIDDGELEPEVAEEGLTPDAPALQVMDALAPLIDHAIGGSIITPSNYEPGGIPAGVGIPHSLINTLPDGDYYAVVFFEGLAGCPTVNYYLNSFQPGSAWAYDIRGNAEQFTHAVSTSAGGCGQRFRVDPNKGDGWMWGALDPNDGTKSMIADNEGVPAFAICATETACDTIAPGAPAGPKVSSVLFLPGIKGSKLYRDNPLCLADDDSCGTPLWLPPGDLSVPQLFLDIQGKSVHDDIYVKDEGLLSEAYGLAFYSSFITQMNEAEESGTYGPGWQFKPIAYDWRLSLPDIVNKGVKHGNRIYYEESTGTPYIEESLRALAQTSPTGKVTIIAHSNGGLVAKALMQKLGDAGSAALIDKVVMVGVPQSGAPRALGALLFGDREGIPGIKHIPDVIMSSASAREFGLHAPMAYHLLPSRQYFEHPIQLSSGMGVSPLISFAPGTLWQTERAAYGPTIASAQELKSFALAEDGGRTMPSPSDLSRPNILSAGIFSYGEDMHASLDAWTPPPEIAVHQIAGWGVETISGLELYERPRTLLGTPIGGYVPSYRPLLLNNGDGTVPAPSAQLMQDAANVHRYSENLAETRGTKRYDHGTLFEIPEVRSFVTSLLTNDPTLPYGIREGEADPPSGAKRLVFYLHSDAAELAVHDGSGRRTGMSVRSIQDAAIPNSTYGELGDVKYVATPAFRPYRVDIQGTTAGSFTLDVEEWIKDSRVATRTISDVPVRPGTRATLSITDGIGDASPLEVDTDGDGVTDLSIALTTGTVTYASSTPPIESPVDTPEPPDGTTAPGENDEGDGQQEPAPVDGPVLDPKGSHARHSSVSSRAVTHSGRSFVVGTTTTSDPLEVVAENVLSNTERATTSSQRTYVQQEDGQESIAAPEAVPGNDVASQTYATQLAAVPESALMRVLSYLKGVLLRALAVGARILT